MIHILNFALLPQRSSQVNSNGYVKFLVIIEKVKFSADNDGITKYQKCTPNVTINPVGESNQLSHFSERSLIF